MANLETTIHFLMLVCLCSISFTCTPLFQYAEIPFNHNNTLVSVVQVIVYLFFPSFACCIDKGKGAL